MLFVEIRTYVIRSGVQTRVTSQNAMFQCMICVNRSKIDSTRDMAGLQWNPQELSNPCQFFSDKLCAGQTPIGNCFKINIFIEKSPGINHNYVTRHNASLAPHSA